jgi:hypothetical protein
MLHSKWAAVAGTTSSLAFAAAAVSATCWLVQGGTAGWGMGVGGESSRTCACKCEGSAAGVELVYCCCMAVQQQVTCSAQGCLY